MQKTRRLTDENSVSFQIFLILLSFIALGSESRISRFQQCQSNTRMSSFIFRGGGVGGGDKHVHEPKCGVSRFFSVKKLNTAFCTSLGSTSRVFSII